jgi:hypothetical protein
MKCHVDVVDIADRLYTFGAPISPLLGILTPIADSCGRRISQVEEARNGRYIVSRPDTEMSRKTLLCEQVLQARRKRSDGVIAP